MKFEEWISAKTPEEAEEYRRRFKMAISNSIRRKILLELEKGEMSFEEIRKALKIDDRLLKYHIDALKKGECVIEESGTFRLTEKGKILAKLVKKKA